MFVLNPGARTETELQMLEGLGALMGMSFRSGILLDIHLSRFIWKQIVGDQLALTDLKYIDGKYVQSLEEMLADSKALSDEEFKTKYEYVYTMSVALSASATEENKPITKLVENGDEVVLTRDKAQFFYDKAIEARLKESK